MYYLFSSGNTSLVVKILSTDADGQCECVIDRRLSPWWEFSRNNDDQAGYARFLHTQPSQGDVLTIPRSMLRPCSRCAKLLPPHLRSDPRDTSNDIERSNLICMWILFAVVAIVGILFKVFCR